MHVSVYVIKFLQTGSLLLYEEVSGERRRRREEKTRVVRGGGQEGELCSVNKFWNKSLIMSALRNFIIIITVD